MPRAVPRHRGFRPQAGLRALGAQRTALQELHARADEVRRRRRRGRAVAPVRRHPRVHRARERLQASEFSAVLSAFYRLAAAAIVANDGVVDKFVGDEAIGLFIPGFSGADHAAKAIAAGRAILEVSGRDTASQIGAIPVGAGVHTGIAYVGSLGSSEQISDFTALGDPVNTTARLASLAAPGELLVSLAVSELGGLDAGGLERRTVDVRGREETLDVYSLRPVAAA